jgi:uncharacterized protein (DUF2147 family)
VKKRETGVRLKKIFQIVLLAMVLFYDVVAADDVIGFWKSHDEKTGKPQIIVAIYEYQQKYYGRVIGSFNKEGVIEDSIYTPVSRTQRLVGDPYYSGLDIIWNLHKKGSKYLGGEILDPKRGKVYNVELWVQDNHLIVRGKLMFFGKNLSWAPATDADFPEGFTKPDLATLIPAIPEIK